MSKDFPGIAIPGLRRSVQVACYLKPTDSNPWEWKRGLALPCWEQEERSDLALHSYHLLDSVGEPSSALEQQRRMARPAHGV